MAGFFKQFLSTFPAGGVCTRVEFAFSQEIVKPNAECFTALIAAWEEAIKPYEQQQPELFQMHKTYRVCDDFCKVLALNENPQNAARCAGHILGSLCYPPFAQSPGPRLTWEVFLITVDGIANDPDKNNKRFALLNPRAAALFAAHGRTPFIQSEMTQISEFVFNWAVAHKVNWR